MTQTTGTTRAEQILKAIDSCVTSVEQTDNADAALTCAKAADVLAGVYVTLEEHSQLGNVQPADEAAAELTMVQRVLACPMPTNDASAGTVRQYLIKLLADCWRLEDGFDGKRPFGNSGWKYEVYGALVDAGLIEGGRDSDGYLDSCDSTEGEQLVAQAIQALGAA